MAMTMDGMDYDDEDEARLLHDNQGELLDYADEQFHDDDIDAAIMAVPKAVHQCNVCNKIFVNIKGLHQHSVIHTDQKPFQCDICGKMFRFKSNLFEHRSVHSGFTPHACPYCGKTCRLKGNLKKHLKTHVSSKQELEAAWKPFASNRRPPQDIPDDAIIVRGSGDPMFTPPSRQRISRKLGLGETPRVWIERIKKGDLLPSMNIEDKFRRLDDLMRQAEFSRFSISDLFEYAKPIPFERFDCPFCKSVFITLRECLEHMELTHPNMRDEKILYCNTCLKRFADLKSMEQHESYHKRVNLLIANNELHIPEPEILVPDSSMADGEYIDDAQEYM
ncbi:unnamed protein product, partial [Mesorhabditis spiculigera]